LNGEVRLWEQETAEALNDWPDFRDQFAGTIAFDQSATGSGVPFVTQRVMARLNILGSIIDLLEREER